jgi:hypothetical protein
MNPLNPLSDEELAALARRAAELPDAPPALLRKALDLFPPPPASGVADVVSAGLRLVQAVLSFDSWARPAVAMGMRAAGSQTRHLLFSAQGRDIDLRISPAAEHFALSGQILGPDESGVVELLPQSGDPQLAKLDKLGEFRLDSVRTGTYQLTLRLGADMIVLPPIEVGGRS